MELVILGEPVPREIEHAARTLVQEDERARIIVAHGGVYDIRATQRLFAGERLVALVAPVTDETDAPVFEIEEA